jgi:hypothetical protein
MASLTPYPVRLRNCLIIFLFAGFIFGVSVAGAQQVFQTPWLKIYYTDPAQLQELERRLPFSAVEATRQLYFYTPSSSPSSPVPLLAAKINGLLTRVCMILNIWPRNRRPLRIFLLKNGLEVRQRQLALLPFRHESSFWSFGGDEEDNALEAFYELRTRSIFLSMADLRVDILAHEMTHYVLNEAFSTPPPASFQEDRAHYVEKQVN